MTVCEKIVTKRLHSLLFNICLKKLNTLGKDLNFSLYSQLAFIILAMVIFLWSMTKTSLRGTRNVSMQEPWSPKNAQQKK